MSTDSAPLSLSDNESLGVFIMLRDRELELDPAMGQLLERIRKRLYLILSVDELEHIERRYRSQVQ